MKQEYEMPSSPVAIPYKWEAAPGTPIAEIVPARPANLEPRPLRPPPGVRKPTKPAYESAACFDGFEPEPPAVAEAQLVEKILKKLNRLRRKSMVASACFTSDAAAQRVIEHSGMLFPVEDLDVCYDSDAARSSYDHPSTPHSSTSYESAFSEPSFGRRNPGTTSAFSSSPYLTRTPPSTRRFEDDVDEYFDLGHTAPLPGPHESAWHIQHSSELKPPPCSEKTRIRRSYSALIPTILMRQSSSSRSFSLGRRPFGRSKAAKQLDLRKL